MAIFDAHCDVLMKLFQEPTLHFSDSDKLQVDKQGLMQAGGKVQCFAIYIPEPVHPDMRFPAALAMVEIFHEKVLSEPGMKPIRYAKDIDNLQEGEIGALLTLEGCDCIGNDILKLKTLLRLGVTSVGLTWNYANLVADGALEPRGGGLSLFGKEAVNTLNEEKVWCDVSHLSEAGFWDVMECADYPIASHSNAYRLCQHPRNLRDDQIRALLVKNGRIGITFVPQFLTGKPVAEIDDILRHIEHICSLGGENQVGFGSDFDGIEETVPGLSNFRQYENLVNELYRHYSAKFVEDILFNNFKSAYPR